jgi:hypothetical protein
MRGREIVYTTNVIEGVRRRLRKATKVKSSLPADAPFPAKWETNGFLCLPEKLARFHENAEIRCNVHVLFGYARLTSQ